jgi:hypothetical protein
VSADEQDEAIATGQQEAWSSVAASINHEVLCSWSEDRHVSLHGGINAAWQQQQQQQQHNSNSSSSSSSSTSTQQCQLWRLEAAGRHSQDGSTIGLVLSLICIFHCRDA